MRIDDGLFLNTHFLDKALALHELGFHVIPIGGAGQRPAENYIRAEMSASVSYAEAVQIAVEKFSKRPRIAWRDYQNRPAEEDEIRAWWTNWTHANIGIVTGCEVVVVDADNPTAVEWIQAGHISVTPWRVTTRRGMHFYFAVNPDLEVRNSANAKAMIDIRGVGGYVVAPGSIHHSGHEYAWDRLEGWDITHLSDLPMLTADDLAAIRGYNQEAHDGEPEATHALMDLSHYTIVADGSPAMEGERNNTAASLAGQFIRTGDSVIETVQRLQAWNRLNPAPLSDGEIHHVGASIAHTHEARTGQKVPLTPPLPPPKPAELARLDPVPFVFPASTLTAASVEPIEHFWSEDLIYRRARMMIAGAPKVGKSRFVLSMAVAAACGGEFLGETFVRPLKVIWMQAEMGRAYLWKRYSNATVGLSAEDRARVGDNLILSERAHLNLYDTTNPDMAGGGFQIMRQIMALHKPDILIIDPIVQFAAVQESDQREVTELLKRIDLLEQEFDCAVVLVHHTRKPTKGVQPSFDDLRGSSAWGGWVDTGVLLTGTAEVNLVQWMARETTRAPMRWGWDSASGRYQCDLEAQAPAAGHGRARSLAEAARMEDLVAAGRAALAALHARETLTLADLVDAMSALTSDRDLLAQARTALVSSAGVYQSPDGGFSLDASVVVGGGVSNSVS